MNFNLSIQWSVDISVAQMGTGKSVDETSGKADTDDQMSYIKNNAKP